MKITVIIEKGNDTDNLDLSFLPANYEINKIVLTKDIYIETISKIPKDHIVINLCDGIDEIGELGECVIRELEKNKLPYTGSSIKSYKCKKSDIKIPNVKTPNAVVIHKKEYTTDMFDKLTYPVIIKPEYSSGSMGITSTSKCDNIDQLMERLKLYEYDDIVVEEFIEGREFTALVCENIYDVYNPIVLEPVECIFTNGYTFKHYDLKWKDYNATYYVPITDDKIKENIATISKKTYGLMNLDSYIRYDMRMDKNGNLYIIDVNPYPAMFYRPDNYGCGDTILANSQIMNHKQFIEHNINCAMHRAKTYQ